MTSTSTSTPTSGTTSGLPTARGYFAQGTDGQVCVDHNRACKTVRTAQQALYAGYDEHLTDGEICVVADAAGVRNPGSPETRAAVRAALRPPLDHDRSDAELSARVRAAAEQGLPFRYTTASGRTYFVVALPAGE